MDTPPNSIDQRLREVDDRLDEISRRNEVSRLQEEITHLERKLRHVELKSNTRELTSDRYQNRSRQQQTSSPNPGMKPPVLSEGNGIPPWLTPIVKSKHSDNEAASVRPRQVNFQSPRPGIGQSSGTTVTHGYGTKVKPATYDGTGSWSDYIAHFEACAKINSWTDCDKGLYLAVSLRGQAQGVLGNLASHNHDFHALSLALQERFAPPNQTELYRCQLRDRRQKAGESLAELAQDIRRLTNLAYPSAPPDLRETLSKEQFIDSLHSADIRLKVKQARPLSLNDAVHHAIELEAFFRAEQRKTANKGILYASSIPSSVAQPSELTDLKEAILTLRNEFKAWSEKPNYSSRSNRGGRFPGNRNRNGNRSGQRRCYECGSEDHIKPNCPRLFNQQASPQKRNTNRNETPNESGTLHQNKGSVNSSSQNVSGLFITGYVAEKNVDCLVDTGATLSLISSRVWASIENEAVKLTEFDKSLATASGDDINILGKISSPVKIDGSNYNCDFVVADIEADVILGLDFLKKEDGKLDLVKNVLNLRGKDLKLRCSGSLGCSRVVVTEQIVIPARSEKIVLGKILSNELSPRDYCLIEPIQKMNQSGGSIVAKSLVRGKTGVPLRILNPLNEPQLLHPGTHVATASQVSEVKKFKANLEQTMTDAQIPLHLQDLYSRTCVGLDDKQRSDVAKLLIRYQDVFSKSDNDIGRTGIIKHKIDTGHAHPVKQPIRRVPMHMNNEVDDQINKMLDKDVIQPSKSPWSSGIVLVKKKDGSVRFCIDYRQLNEVTVKDAYPLPRIDDCLDQLAGNQWFSCLDLNSGYWQLEVDEQDREKTAFNSRRGLFEFKVMPFGLCNAPATFERLMETVLTGLQWEICLIYLDDVIVTGKTFEAMISNLNQVLERFREAGLKLKAKKCHLFAKEVEFLGHVVSAEGIRTDQKKTEAIQTWPEPKCAKDVRSFLGLCSYYRRFILRFAEIAKPLHRLTEKGKQFEWTQECSTSFKVLKKKLTEAPILAHPDFTKPFILDTDASELAIGAVLSQNIDGVEHAVAYASRTLSKSERRYCVTRKELLALVYFVKYFRHYLYGKQFRARTDHGSLKWLLNFKNPEGQVARWIETLSAFDMVVEHRAGTKHRNADALSRRVCKQCGLDCVIKDGNSSPGANQIFAIGHDIIGQNNDLEDLITIQSKDKDICVVRHWVEQGVRPEFQSIQDRGHFIKSLWSQFNRLSVHDNLLMRRWDVLGTNITNWQAIVPLSQRRMVLGYCHDIRASGHLGINKTLNKVRQKYYWPGLQNDVKTYVNGCEKCAKRKGPNVTKRAPMQITRSGYPMERIAMDILGELPETELGNRYILVVSDYFTKWTESYPMPNMEAATVAKLVVEQLICRFGVPQKIHSDQGRQFESKLFQEICKMLHIEKTRTTPYHPESDGMVERFNRTLCTMLSAYVDENHRDWDAHLPYVMMAYRSAEHETTGMTPNRLMLGRETSTPLDIIYGMPTSIKTVPTRQWAWELQEMLEDAHQFVREYTGRSISRQKQYHDNKLSYEELNEDDKVYVFFPVRKVGTSSKFTSYWKGPFQVVEKISEVLYKVNCGRDGSYQVIHVDRLKKVKEQTLERDTEVIPLLSQDDDDEYVEPQGENFDDTRIGKRTRRRPAWHDDYCFSLSRSEMAKTKTTPRKVKTICAVCKSEVPDGMSYEQHVLECVKTRQKCDICEKDFKNKDCLKRHKKIQHKTKQEETQERSDDSEWDEDPEVNLDDPSTSLDEGRIIRKRTAPAPVHAPVKLMKISSDVGSQTLPVEQKRFVSRGSQTDQKHSDEGEKGLCKHCGIMFQDITMYFIHMGCHTHNAPFLCNICGEQCKDKVDFLVHTTHGHRK